ncbi:hypothetical protein ACHHYP_01315 [Achlya hypogyna]|uniref:Uncharacterized protein n=1 Tax=Achlya hypogyna TaxID=1202772 RepID=A0A1V9Z8Z0_ACHHY|nr:hypothetical protein ACHHYP_01315 [Achlya hypogyna]
MNKGQVYLPAAIMGQMAFRRFTMMKLFAGAMGASLISKSIFRTVLPDEFKRMQAARASSPSSVPVLVSGGLILGAGMTISGSCPGSVYVQLGAQLPSAAACFGGTVLGTALAASLRSRIAAWEKHIPKVTSTLAISSIVQAFMGVGCVVAAVVLELVVPEAVPATFWFPSVGGAVVGFLQLPMALFVRKSIGASASVKILLGEVANAWEGTFGKRSWAPRVPDISQAIFVLGVVAGSFAATYNGVHDATQMYPGTLQSVIGGAMIAFGASIAGGCTSGHGLSGTAMLMTSSWTVLPAMFAGGMGTAAVQYILGF